MRVLLITNYREGVGGISGQVALLREHLAGQGIAADIFSTRGSLSYRLRLFRRLRREGKDYDLFHIHCCSNFGFLPAVVGITVGRRLGKRIVLTYHGGDADRFFGHHTRLVRHYLLRTDANIVLSGFLSGIFRQYGIPHTVIPNVVEMDESHYRERERVRPCFISTRTLSPLYNIECIIHAFSRVCQEFPEARLTVVGDGPSRPRLEQMVRDLHLEGHVAFTGRVANETIYDYLDQADIFLSAPRIDNMPVSVLEAFNAGLLVISSRVGGVPYMVTDGTTGFLFESDNAEQLAQRMLSAVENPEQTIRMTKAAHNLLEQYSWNNVWTKLSAVYGL